MNFSRKEAIHFCLRQKLMTPFIDEVHVFAPANLAMIKYWGKRNIDLNLPVTSSLSISLKDKGTKIHLKPKLEPGLELYINDEKIDPLHKFHQRFNMYLADFPFYEKVGLTLKTESNIPIGAGLASSSSAFAALVKGLDALFGWQCDLRILSILARMGSGSAARSFWDDFVIWHQGKADNGMDSYAEPLNETWEDLKIGLLILQTCEKSIGSTEAMIRTTETSKFYKKWPDRVQTDLTKIKLAIKERNFNQFGKIAEDNARFMHQTMHHSIPFISYDTAETLQTISKVQFLRDDGLEIYFTQDAGPNIKLLFLEKDTKIIKTYFQDVIKI